METKKKLENFNTIGCQIGHFNIIHRRGYKTTVKFNDKDYTFYIAKGKRHVDLANESPRFYYAYEASTGMRVCGLGSDTVESAYSQLFSDSFVRAFTKLIESGELIKLQDRFQLALKREDEDERS